ncbi:MAG: HDOD domain-containing protein [Desulfatitalea sp.]|nr:HDOD domain-containing protein [Desulfatitalea sp.]NNK00366.1 HDOD domain-containing protein [Desulfatitalea sp.]
MFDFFKRRKAAPKEELKALLGGYELQSFPAAVMNVLGMLRDPHSEIKDIADQIQMDPGMNIKILQLVNSTAFGLVTKVSNIHHAVTILGRSRLESMLLTYAVSTTIPPKLNCMEVSRFWQASARRACLAKQIALHLHAATQAESFTAALLQDMAIPLISEGKNPLYKDLLIKWHAHREADIDFMERALLGYDHPAIGALAAEGWELPEYLIHAIAGHHDLSEQSPADPAVRLVSLVRYFDEDDGTERLLKTAEKNFGIGKNMMEEMLLKAFSEAEQFADTFR